MKKLKTAITLFAALLFINSVDAQSQAKSTISTERLTPEICKVKFANGPVNLIIPETIASLNETVKELSKDEHIKVVIFSSEVSGYFYNHFDLGQFPNFVKQTGADGKPLWVELVTNLSKAPFISIASIRGRTQGGGDELTLAFDLRYASKELAVFNQPEVGVGLFPGGGSTNQLPRLTGRDRALEILISADDYNADIAERYGWVTRAVPDDQLDKFVMTMASRIATFDKTALVTVKQQINAVAYPPESEILNSQIEFQKSLAWPGLSLRIPVLGKMLNDVGPLKVEKNMGYYIGEANKQLQKK
ncbi:enoyl-CoA hydratase/isomerase family protein [Mucilaginibacter rubeus]|uniref:Enoyl-CoA hydratase/isomerase family protein n=1 Tax=Mucilaginibacter rubeus TaxID=2027860 RepID=A0AAE6JK95_9SPHI|nr:MULTISPECIES: enoyl-CoA hydratase/isomerase family protein [Mucilaginibacter]QEM07181.1 enoyl-CoA hydratase/isomerase family protein [Mucilaginibacter rubeus]QEM19637.1 enoyl-CoA hydratase/isomerase family protein [Mucilaginibacter gossypii]QTE43669.1 enoyl-CoA hydratase/isomerase family protein [Mucilaginibacter rubeus]QTE50269.1 enoyl-CoA hydratase/isomerase family protein [Mucilaginibacter rubeus]QTE55356.1 enoyl-CoA hydratase/isomerase family protein [Mucilaginibacter rubeus]